jgi:hypothetical protein
MSVESVARLRISLDDITPEIWRMVDFPTAGSLKMLHDVVQAAMGWQDYHLWHFEVEGRRYGLTKPDLPHWNVVSAKNAKFSSLLDRGARQLTYTYDMGDDWRHTVTVEGVRTGESDTKYPRLVAGERRCPPEDVGGWPGFEMFLEAMADPTHESHDELVRWYGGRFDPDDMGELATSRAVAAIAIRRHAGKAANLKSRAV